VQTSTGQGTSRRRGAIDAKPALAVLAESYGGLFGMVKADQLYSPISCSTSLLCRGRLSKST
jgi:hypothetical protein